MLSFEDFSIEPNIIGVGLFIKVYFDSWSIDNTILEN